ncbi:MAG: hypothetical protein WD187_02830 [Candidatus Woykebacteria bacterium]
MSLAELSLWVRSALKWAVGAAFIFIVLLFGWIIISSVSSSVFKPRGADAAFGILGQPIFTKTLNNFKSKQYEIEANLPKALEKVEVFEMSQNAKFNEEELERLTSAFGLKGSEKTETDGLTTWNRRSGTEILELGTGASHFTYRFDISKNQSLYEAKASLNKESAIEKAKELFEKLKLTLENKNINDKNSIVTYYDLSPEGRAQTSEEEANAVEIGFFRQVSKILSSGDAPIRILFARGGNDILEFDFYFSPIDTAGAPYPIKTSTQAWEEVKEGKAFSRSIGEFGTVKITSVSLSYWESRFFQPYLQPIWVFSGTGETNAGEVKVQAFVPAINSDYLSTPAAGQSSDQAP